MDEKTTERGYIYLTLSQKTFKSRKITERKAASSNNFSRLERLVQMAILFTFDFRSKCWNK